MILGSKQLNWSIPYSLNFTKWVEYRSGVYVIYRIAYLNYHEAIYIGITENRSLGERIYDHTMPSDEVQMYRDNILLVKYAPIYWEYERVFVESYLATTLKPLIPTRVSGHQIAVNLPHGFIDIESTLRQLRSWASLPANQGKKFI